MNNNVDFKRRKPGVYKSRKESETLVSRFKRSEFKFNPILEKAFIPREYLLKKKGGHYNG
jgi:hypothetical protein